jgi:hypothetical protein
MLFKWVDNVSIVNAPLYFDLVLGLQFETNPPSELPYAAVQRSKGF